MKPPADSDATLQDEDFGLDEVDRNAIRFVYWDLVDLRRAGVPEDFAREKRRTGELRPIAKTASGLLLFESVQARAVVEAYWQSQHARALLDAHWRIRRPESK
jgi:hypothetical protein